MKTILLTTTALVAFAGAAAAEGHTGVNFGGSATLGYNDDAAGDNFGFYSDIEVDVTLTAELDNGVTVTATADIDELNAGTADFGGVTLKIASETASLTYGDVNGAANDNWSSVGDMDSDGFYEQDGETVLRGDMSFGDIALSTSYEVAGDTLVGLNVAASATFGSVSVAGAYQADDGVGAEEIFGVRAGVAVAGADIALGYASNETTGSTSTGVSVSYPVGPVTLSASYVDESAGDANWDVSAAYAAGAVAIEVSTDESDMWAVEGSYDMGNGLTVLGGAADGGDTMYVAGSYDLGGGAALLASYVDTDAVNADDEYGANDYQNGMTVEVSFSF